MAEKQGAVVGPAASVARKRKIEQIDARIKVTRYIISPTDGKMTPKFVLFNGPLSARSAYAYNASEFFA